MAARILLAAMTVFAAVQHAVAQTWTYCNPLNKTCPPDPALGGFASFDMTQKVDPAVWNTTAGPMSYTSNGAEFTISERGQSPTIQSQFYIMFGSVSVILKAASGTGIISSIVLESDDLDEIDWEWMGGNTTHVETNFFGKGNTTTYNRAIYYPVDDPQNSWHNYTVHWTAEQLQWWIDGQMVRSLDYDGNGTLNGYNYPQTPMTVRLGIWAGGDPKQPEGVIQWAGGITDYKDIYTMMVKSVNVTDFSTGKQYTYSDMSGSWQSIKATAGNSTILNEIYQKHGVTGLWDRLTTGAKSGIVIGAISAAGVLLAALLVCCVVQARKGKKEKAIADAQWEKEQAEFNEYRMQMLNGGFSKSANTVPQHTSYAQGPTGKF
ncbi:uncharacterized protein PV09_01212 [Verruconis gallopava]|uniref:chitinase n=1 Tax=Verruconis gallopava TaxID=253628 RepID=A0A0D2BAD0_9PEZI|nr:uncharacterized protein PV09_01212 [Verruconis gallopava]KIW08294.1 hypothetical protein PV09_01212 [Verruconis gallopava]